MCVLFFDASYGRVIAGAIFSLLVPVPIETVRLHRTGLNRSSFFDPILITSILRLVTPDFYYYSKDIRARFTTFSTIVLISFSHFTFIDKQKILQNYKLYISFRHQSMMNSDPKRFLDFL
jgi:hypothetical protein